MFLIYKLASYGRIAQVQYKSNFYRVSCFNEITNFEI